MADDGGARLTLVDPDTGERLATTDRAGLAALVREYEAHRPRWVWHDTRDWAPVLLAAGVRVERCHDLRLGAAILEHSTLTAGARLTAPPRPEWLRRGPAEAIAAGESVPVSSAAGHVAGRGAATLFDDGWDEASDDPAMSHHATTGTAAAGSPTTGNAPHGDMSPGGPARLLVAEYRRQLALVEASDGAGRLRLLLAAESAGALIASELAAAGVPWSSAVHEDVLEDLLGPRPFANGKPARMLELATEVRRALDAPRVNLDSQADLLRALRAAGLGVESTSRWELRELEHPAIEPLIAYKKLARVLSANGWAWLEEWVVEGRFRPEYVPGGAASGRWATAGGGALQLPKQIRRALVADPGWRLVVADAAQLEPRVLAGMSHDLELAAAGRGRDLYAGLVDAGVVATRTEAKYAMLGAIYGATSGESGRLVPRLARTFPRAMALVDRAADEGARGARVTTLLGRSSPLPGDGWRAAQSRASQPDASPADERRARTAARDWGRFTRNFVVQGTAAEWAVIWMAELRRRLATIGERSPAVVPAEASGPVFARVPHLVYFLHDEVIVHAPAEHAEAVAAAVHASAAEAGRLLFGEFPVEFPLDLRVVESYAEAG
ncbi:bifunctional 3'-5' exonuclease/DNA polymerase [Agromyces sp. LY-1074]|nr:MULTISPECIES: bifunctional 3'-5' exonuclease/DNA polymerase [unclassified Agromyces]MDR5700185.1 bifunctional 3'-5' exonuclease/DNA polymerase [Agromyces sp. LY-1074]MDR5706447.1 bifunctional 3'-5' exonuclease/DNA polymerase [Agromyces sp. LY-1358]